MAKTAKQRKQRSSDVPDEPMSPEDALANFIVFALPYAVDVWMERLRQKGGPDKKDQDRAEEIWPVLAEHSPLLFTGVAPCMFDHLAEVLAISAFKPRGVKAFGYHFKAKIETPSARKV